MFVKNYFEENSILWTRPQWVLYSILKAISNIRYCYACKLIKVSSFDNSIFFQKLLLFTTIKWGFMFIRELTNFYIKFLGNKG